MIERQIVAHLGDERTSLVFVGAGGMPELAYWGAWLGSGPLDVSMFERPVPNGGLDIDPPVGLVTEASGGWFGKPGIEGSRSDRRDFSPRFEAGEMTETGSKFRMSLHDAQAELHIELVVELDGAGVASFRATVRNDSRADYWLGALRLSLPVWTGADEVLTFGGRHAFEFAQHRNHWTDNCIVVENRHGKTSHERLGAVVVGTSGVGQRHGQVWGCHIGWSGNFEIICDAISDGRHVVQLGEVLVPGEVVLSTGDSYTTPTAYGVYSPDGMCTMSRSFHDHLRIRPHHPKRPRPVHLNTWEAV
jgi:alpha-galactosidase